MGGSRSIVSLEYSRPIRQILRSVTRPIAPLVSNPSETHDPQDPRQNPDQGGCRAPAQPPAAGDDPSQHDPRPELVSYARDRVAEEHRVGEAKVGSELDAVESIDASRENKKANCKGGYREDSEGSEEGFDRDLWGQEKSERWVFWVLTASVTYTMTADAATTFAAAAAAAAAIATTTAKPDQPWEDRQKRDGHPERPDLSTVRNATVPVPRMKRKGKGKEEKDAREEGEGEGVRATLALNLPLLREKDKARDDEKERDDPRGPPLPKPQRVGKRRKRAPAADNRKGVDKAREEEHQVHAARSVGEESEGERDERRCLARHPEKREQRT